MAGCALARSLKPELSTSLDRNFLFCPDTKGKQVLPILVLATISSLAGQTQHSASDWAIYVANDACSDYTWGFNEEQTRHAYADVVRDHLDEMLRTDKEKPENQDRYNLSITQEALAFIEYYPERTPEPIRRIKESRISVGPVYNNALWGFQSTEAVIRTFYPARHLERDWGIPLSVAQHIEQPSLPWGVASILAASGFRWLSVPYLDYDSTFAGLKNPVLFDWEGPDGATVHVVMDKFASQKANYVQGAYILKEPRRISDEWLPHYSELGDFCLSGCFSKTQYVVFAANVAHANSKLGRDRGHVAGSVRPSSPALLPDRACGLNCGATGPQARRNVGSQLPLLTTTSGGLLKQPDKQKVARFMNSGPPPVIRFDLSLRVRRARSSCPSVCGT